MTDEHTQFIKLQKQIYELRRNLTLNEVELNLTLSGFNSKRVAIILVALYAFFKEYDVICELSLLYSLVEEVEEINILTKKVIKCRQTEKNIINIDKKLDFIINSYEKLNEYYDLEHLQIKDEGKQKKKVIYFAFFM